MEDPMSLSLAQYWNPDSEQEWENYISRFALKSRGERVDVLCKADEWLAMEARPTKEFSSMWQRKRQLEGLHWKLSRIGK
jgi:hypothetical protein